MEEKRDYYIHTTLSFVANLLRSGNFTSAKKYCKELNEYDEDNAEILNYYLCAEMETVSSSFDNIDRLKDMSIIEKMLLTRDTVFARQELLLRVVNACIKFLQMELLHLTLIIWMLPRQELSLEIQKPFQL